MPPVPSLSAKDILDALQRAGFVIMRQNGSHIILQRKNTHRTAEVPRHNPVSKGTLRSIIRQADMTVEEFLLLL